MEGVVYDEMEVEEAFLFLGCTLHSDGGTKAGQHMDFSIGDRGCS